ncbi:MAG: hypothetical protein ABJC33_06120 [Betaproteobacteria bacterium]
MNVKSIVIIAPFVALTGCASAPGDNMYATDRAARECKAVVVEGRTDRRSTEDSLARAEARASLEHINANRTSPALRAPRHLGTLDDAAYDC